MRLKKIKIRKIFAILMMAVVLCNSLNIIASENENVINGEENIIAAYNDSLTMLKNCTVFEYDVAATATAEVYMGHAQNKSAKFTEELCIEQGIPFELTTRQQDTVDSWLIAGTKSFLNNYWSMLENGEEFEKLNRENADWYTKLYLSSPEYPEFKFELEMFDKYVKINETTNIATGETIPESYFYSQYVMFRDIDGFCDNIEDLDYIKNYYEGINLETRTYNGEELDYIEKLTFEVDMTEDIYFGFFADIAKLNETVKGKVEQFKWENGPSGWYNRNMYVYTFEGSKDKIIFAGKTSNSDEQLNISPNCVYDEEKCVFVYDENFDFTGNHFGMYGTSDSGKIEDVYIYKGFSRGVRKNVYLPVKNVEYEFYKESYGYNPNKNIFALFHSHFSNTIKPQQVAVPEPVQKEDNVQEKKEKEKETQTKPEKITVYINGEKVEFDQDPIISENRTLVPMRAIFEALGAEVKWNEESRTVTAIKDDTVITIRIDENNMLKNGESVVLEAAPTIVNNRTLVPVRAIAESFGNEVSWNEVEMRVDVG